MAPALHIVARSQANPTYPQRFAVPDAKVPWATPWPEYTPTEFTVSHNGASWADLDDPKAISDLEGRLSHEGAICLDVASGMPVNPAGRTGIRGRGRLGKWGPNHAADPIVTRYHPATGELQFVVIQRRDTSEWALPGGMVDPGEAVSATVKREFTEEAGNVPEEQRQRFQSLSDQLFGAGGETVYRGYVDDPRNTDNAWLETVAMHYHCSSELGAMLPLEAGDDAKKVKWVTYSADLALYADHRAWLDRVAATMRRRRLLKKAASLALPALILGAALLLRRRAGAR